VPLAGAAPARSKAAKAASEPKYTPEPLSVEAKPSRRTAASPKPAPAKTATAKPETANPAAVRTAPVKAGSPAAARARKSPQEIQGDEAPFAALRKTAAIAVEVRSAPVHSVGAASGAAVALQRSPEPDSLASFDPLEDEDELDLEDGEFTAASPYSSKDLYQRTSAASDYNPAAAMSPEERRLLRDQVVLEHLPLVRAIAVRVHENLPVHVELDDLVHAGIMGLFDASSKYNPDKKVAFSSYAKHRIKGAILDSLRQLDWASRDLRRRHKQIEQVTRDLAATLHRNPTEEEVAGKMGVEVDRWRQMMVDLRNVGLISASTRGTEHDDLPAPDFPAKPELQPDSMCAYEQLKQLLGTAMEALPERYRKVVLMYYKSELTMKEIGTHLGINESRVSQIHKSALEKMANALQQAGVESSQAF